MDLTHDSPDGLRDSDHEGFATADGAASRIALAGMLLLVAAGSAVDLVLDAPTTLVSPHVLFELALAATCLGVAVYLWRGWRRTARSLVAMRQELLSRQAAMQAERDAWRERARDALEDLGRAVDRQFEAWGLTPAEREVALLLLKGYGHKQAAALTGRSERTVRQHAVAVYHKAGLAGRAELAAFFLEDLLLPQSAESRAAG